MFGIISPCLSQLNSADKRAYQSIYCNLCAGLSRTFGLYARPLVVNDVVSLDWLLNKNNCSDHLFKTVNCLKGGTLCGSKQPLSKRQQFLAAISAYTITVKLADNAQDSPSLKTKLAYKLYSKVERQAKALLKELEFDYEKIESMLTEQIKIEREQITNLDIVSYPTSHCYGLVAKKIAELGENTQPAIAKDLGEYMGKCVFFVDAIRDINEDLKNHSYNPFIIAGEQNADVLIKHSVAQVVPYLIERQQHLFANLIDTTAQLDKKWSYISNHIKGYLQKFVQQTNDLQLFQQLQTLSCFTKNKRTDDDDDDSCCCPCSDMCCGFCGDCAGPFSPQK